MGVNGMGRYAPTAQNKLRADIQCPETLLKNLILALLALTSTAAYAASKAQVTTLEAIPGKICEIVGDFPGVSGSEITYGMSGNPVIKATAKSIQGLRDLAVQQGANTVLGLKIQMIPLERNRGKEFGDVIAFGTFANCK